MRPACATSAAVASAAAWPFAAEPFWSGTTRYRRWVTPIPWTTSGPSSEAWRTGAALSLDEAVAYARRARGSRRRPQSGWGRLTPAEVEVVRLAVDGLTNPQIGARLFMSRSTVKSHLSHVYAKLDVANRTELAALAAARLDPSDQGSGAAGAPGGAPSPARRPAHDRS